MKTITNLHINTLNVKTASELANSSIEGEKALSVRLDKEQHRKLKLLAFSADTTMSELIRAFLAQLIEQYHKENVIDGEPGSQD